MEGRWRRGGGKEEGSWWGGGGKVEGGYEALLYVRRDCLGARCCQAVGHQLLLKCSPVRLVERKHLTLEMRIFINIYFHIYIGLYIYVL